MAHFAEIDGNNTVLRVVVVPDEQEKRGQEFLSKDLGLEGKWIQTSYNKNIRGKFASMGDIYDEENDEFIAPIEPEPTAEELEAEAEKQTKLESAKAKLTALGLDEAEVQAILGL